MKTVAILISLSHECPELTDRQPVDIHPKKVSDLRNPQCLVTSTCSDDSHSDCTTISRCIDYLNYSNFEKLGVKKNNSRGFTTKIPTGLLWRGTCEKWSFLRLLVGNLLKYVDGWCKSTPLQYFLQCNCCHQSSKSTLLVTCNLAYWRLERSITTYQ